MSLKEAPRRKVTCFECGKSGHVKDECPTIQKKNKFQRKKEKRQKKAYAS